MLKNYFDQPSGACTQKLVAIHNNCDFCKADSTQFLKRWGEVDEEREKHYCVVTFYGIFNVIFFTLSVKQFFVTDTLLPFRVDEVKQST